MAASATDLSTHESAAEPTKSEAEHSSDDVLGVDTDQSTAKVGAAAVAEIGNRYDADPAQIMRAVQLIGGALISIAIVVVVLIEVFSLEAIEDAEEDSDWGGIMESLTSTGAAALGLLVIGLLVVAANNIMGWFGNGGGGM